jgi:hypothetical protein
MGNSSSTDQFVNALNPNTNGVAQAFSPGGSVENSFNPMTNGAVDQVLNPVLSSVGVAPVQGASTQSNTLGGVIDKATGGTPIVKSVVDTAAATTLTPIGQLTGIINAPTTQPVAATPSPVDTSTSTLPQTPSPYVASPMYIPTSTLPYGASVPPSSNSSETILLIGGATAVILLFLFKKS